MGSAQQAAWVGRVTTGMRRPRADDKFRCPLQVRRHEPCSALDGGDGHGTVSLDHLCAGAVSMLRSGGFLALETAGGSQAHAVAAFLTALKCPLAAAVAVSAGLSMAGTKHHWRTAENRTPAAAFRRIEVVKDMFGVDRFVTAWRT